MTSRSMTLPERRRDTGRTRKDPAFFVGRALFTPLFV